MSNSSWKICRIRGIQLEIHFSFLLLLGFYAYIGHQAMGANGAIALTLMIALVFVSVALHELGHSFTAQYYGIKVPRIVLLAIGGMAQMASIPREPKKELIITINGPLVNFVLALILFAALAIHYQSPGEVAQGTINILKSYVSEERVRTPYNPFLLNWTNLAWGLLAWNIAMGLFNLLPIFPMDGGRLLRALLAQRISYLLATRIAATLAKVIAATGIAWALLTGHWLLAILLGFIWVGGEEELKYVRMLESLMGKTVRQVMSPPPLIPVPVRMGELRLKPDELIDPYLPQIFAEGGVGYPVYQDQHLIGFVYSDQLLIQAQRK